MNIEEMRRVAEAATPSPWVAGSNNYQKPLSEWSVDRFDPAESDDDKNPVISDSIRRKADARFIATFNPAVVLGLLDALELLKECKEELDKHWFSEDGEYNNDEVIELSGRIAKALVGAGRGG